MVVRFELGRQDYEGFKKYQLRNHLPPGWLNATKDGRFSVMSGNPMDPGGEPGCRKYCCDGH